VPEAKPYAIPKQLVWDAYQRVRAAAGVDGESLAAFENDLKNISIRSGIGCRRAPIFRRPCGLSKYRRTTAVRVRSAFRLWRTASHRLW